MNIEVHHAEPFGQTETFAHVADVDVAQAIGKDAARPDVFTALEVAYVRTQNVMGSWSRGRLIGGRPNDDFSSAVTVRAALPVVDGKAYGLRSTSVGDRMKVGDQWYVVAEMGFKPL